MTPWPMVRLADVGNWRGGGTPSKSIARFWVDGDVPWLSPKDMGSETLSGTRDAITRAALSESPVRLVDAGSVAVVVRSGILERTLPVAVVPFETTLNQDMKAVVPHDGIDVRWIAWAIRAKESWVLANARKDGTTVASLDWQKFASMRVPLPPLREQRRILALLEDHISRLEAAASYVSAASQRSRVLLEHSVAKQFHANGGKTSTLGAIAKWGSGGTPSARTLRYYENGSIPWVNSGDLKDADVVDVPKKITELGLADSSAKWVPEGSVLIAMYGATIGKTGLTRVPVTTNQAIAFATPTSEVDARWLQWYLRSQRAALRGAGQGGAQPNISQTVLKSWPVVVPSPSQQVSQVAACEQVESQVEALRLGLMSAQKRSRVLRRALLSAAFSGRLTDLSSDVDRAEELLQV